MATQQHPAFDSDSNPKLEMGGSLRTAAWSKDHVALAPRPAEKVHYGRLWMAAILEAQSWKAREKGKNPPVLKTKWEEAKASIDTNSQILRNVIKTGHKLGGDAEILLANPNILRQSLEETNRVVRKASELPAVECGEWKCSTSPRSRRRSRLRCWNCGNYRRWLSWRCSSQ